MKKLIILVLALIFISMIINSINSIKNKNYSLISPLIENLSFEDVIKSSSLIIIGNVNNINSFYVNKMILNDKGEPVKSYKIIVSEASVEIEEIIKGHIDEKSIRVRFLGGSINKNVMESYELPKLTEKEKVILYLDNNNYLGDGNYYTIFNLGKFNIKNGIIEENPLLKEKLLTLSDLIKMIKNILSP